MQAMVYLWFTHVRQVSNQHASVSPQNLPAPLLDSLLGAKGSKQTGQDHDDVGHNSRDDGAAVRASQEAQVEQQQRSGQAPVDIASPVDLTEDFLVCVGKAVAVGDRLGDVVIGHAVAGGHGKVGDGGDDGDGGGEDMVQAFGLGEAVSGEARLERERD